MPPDAPAAQQQQPAGQNPGQPPFGSSPATGPTPNKGMEVAAVKLMATSVDGLMKAAQMVGPSSEPGKVLLDCIKRISNFVPPDSVTPQDKIRILQAGLMEAQKAGQQMMQMRQAQAAPAGGAPGQPPGQHPPAQMPAAAA